MRKSRQATIVTTPKMIFSSTTLPNILNALALFPWPRRIDVSADPPTPTIEPKAAVMLMIGIHIPSPDMANGPTPCPMKILSVILYSAEVTVATIAGMAYRTSSFDNRSVPNETGVTLFWDIHRIYLLGCKDTKY